MLSLELGLGSWFGDDGGVHYIKEGPHKVKSTQTRMRVCVCVFVEHKWKN